MGLKNNSYLLENVTMKNLSMLIMAAALLCAPMAALASEETDMAKISCKEFLAQDKEKIGMMLVWIDGYMSAKSDNTVMSSAWMEKLGTHMGTYCGKNPGKTIMDAINAME